MNFRFLNSVKFQQIRWAMLVVTAFTLFCSMPVKAQQFDAQYPDESLSVRLKKISTQAGASILFDPQLVGDARSKVVNSTKNLTTDQLIAQSLQGTSFTYKKTAVNAYAVIKRQSAQSVSGANAVPTNTVIEKNDELTGEVTDENGDAVIGATISVKGTSLGTVTGENGDFSLSIPEGGATISISYMGYIPQEIRITDQSSIHIILKEDQNLLDEVVVVGYGTQKKVNMTGAVSSIKINALSERPVTNLTNALAGLAAGLSVSNTGGNTPGYESQTIRIHGQGTLNNADPLIVIDGMVGASMSDLNPQDIEAISILKDAASSAIYGSRAANGVILITTKKGAEGTAKITYSGNVSFEKVAKRLNLVTNYADFMEIQNAGLLANGQAPRFSQGKIDEWRNDAGKNPTVYPNTDWQDHIYANPSVVQNHTISAIGGSRTFRYNLSIGYINNPGMIYNTNYERYQLRSNVDVDIKPWLTVGTNLFGYVDANNPSADVAAAGGDVIWGSGAFNSVPGMTLYDPETGFYGGIQNPEEENVSNFNPYRRMWFYKDEFPVRTRRTVARVYARLKPVRGLTIEGSYSYNYWDRISEYQLCDRDLYRFTLEGPVLIREGVVRTYINRYNDRNTFRTSDVTARYEFNVNKLNTSVMIGASQEYNKAETEGFVRYDLVDESLTSLNAAATDGRILGNYTEWAMRSYFGRVNFVWDDKYMLEANLRADGSSKFAPNERWGYFPSVSAGWRITQEQFMKSTQNWLNSLKLRASYGSLGNNATSSYYMYQSLYSATNYILGGTINGGLSQTVLSNPSLTWESTYMTDFGIDYGFLDNRLSGSFDWFNKDTKGILISLPIPLEHGTTTPPNQNAGEVNNRGFDFDINWTDNIGKVTYSAGFNLGFVSNEVTKFQGDVSSINGVYKIQEGKPINQLYVLSVDRIVRDQTDMDYIQSLVNKDPNYFATYQRPELGDFLYADANGDGKLNADDRVEIGHGSTPRFTYGANLGLSWNNFDLRVLLQGVGHHQVYYNNQAFRFVTVMGQSLNKDITDNAWTPENPYNSKYPILRNNANGKNNIASDAFVHNAAYLRFKNVQLGYTVPRHITQKFFIEGLTIYTSVDNLFTFTDFPGLDPEIATGVGYPAIRQYSVGLNVSF